MGEDCAELRAGLQALIAELDQPPKDGEAQAERMLKVGIAGQLRRLLEDERRGHA